MCEDCSFENIDEFDSQDEFDDFLTILTNRTRKGELEYIQRNPESLEILDRYDYYKCTSCEQIWVLSIPENAWRGYFLPQNKAIERTDKLLEKQKQRRTGCLITIILIICLSVIVWQMA